MVGKICGKTPFDHDILSLNIAEIDFILEMESIYHPDRLKFRRSADQEIADIERKVAWANVVTGPDPGTGAILASASPELMAILGQFTAKKGP